MKSRKTLVMSVFAMMLLLGTGSAQARTVIFDDPSAPTKATRILNLDVPGFALPFNVEFNLQAVALEIYGPHPGEFPIFNNTIEATDARNAVNAALQGAGATALGEVGLPTIESQGFNVGFGSFFGPFDLPAVRVARGWGFNDSDSILWVSVGINELLYNADVRTYAEFTAVPEPVSILLLAAGGIGSLVVRRKKSRLSRN
jgi:hypothetical protein